MASGNSTELRIVINADGSAAIRGIRQVGDETRRMASDVRSVESSAQSAAAALQKMVSAAQAFVGFQALASAAKELFNVAARIEDLNAQYKAMTGSAGAAAAEMGYIREAANRLSMNLDGARDSYGKLLVMVDAGLLNMNQARQMFEGLSAYARVAGSSSAQVGMAMYGLSQALGQGRVQMTELLQITEPLPGALNRIATAAHMTTGELRAMVMDQSGPGVSSAQLRDWVIAAFGDAVKTAEGMSDNLSATLTRTSNSWREFMESFAGSSGFSDVAREALNSITDLLGNMKSDALGDLAQNIGVVLVAALRELTGTIRFVIDNLQVLATVYLGSKLVQALNIGRAAILTYGLTIEWMTGAMTGMAGTTVTLTTVTTAFAAAARVAMAAFWPLLIVAAGAYILLADNTDHAAEASASYNTVLAQTGGSVESLTEKYRLMTAAQKAAVAVSTAEELRKQQQALDKQAEAMQETIRGIGSVIAGQFGNQLPKGLLGIGFKEALGGDESAIGRFITGLTTLSQKHAEYNTVVTSGFMGQKNLQLELAKQYQEWLKTKEGVEATRRILDALNNGLPETAQNLEAVGKAASGAGKEFETAMQKARDAAAAFAMNPMEKAVFEAAGLGANATQQDLNKAYAAYNKYMQDVLEARKRNDAEAEAIAANEARRSAEQAARMESELTARAALDKMVRDGGLTQTEAMTRAKAIQESTYKQVMATIDVEGALARVQRNVTEERSEGARQAVIDSNRQRDAAQQQLTALQQQGEAAAKLVELRNKAAEEALKYGLPGSETYQAVYTAKLQELEKEEEIKRVEKERTDELNKQQQLLKQQAEASNDLNLATQQRMEDEKRMADVMRLRAELIRTVQENGSVEIALAPQIDGAAPYFQGIIKSEADARAAMDRHVAVLNAVRDEYTKLADKGISYTTEQWKAFVDNFNSAEDQKVLDSLNSKTDALREQGDELERSIGLVLANADAYSEEAIQQQIATAASAAWTVGKQEETKVLLARIEQQIRYNAALGALKSVIDQGKTAMDNMRSPADRLAEALKKAADAEAALADPAVQAALKKQGVTLEQARAYIAAYRQEAETTASVVADAFKSAADSTYSAWTTMFEELFSGNTDAFQNFVDNLKNIFIKALAQMAAAALAQPILVPVLQMMGGVMGVGGAQQSAILNSIIPGAGSAAGSGGLFGGVGGTVSGAIGGLGSLLGSTGMMAGGAMMGNLGLIGGITQSITGGIGMVMSGAVTTGLGMLAAAAIPIVGAIAAVTALMGDFGPTPHPSSLAVAGGYNDPKWGPGYMGKGGGGTFSDSGMEYGFSYGHTDPKDAQALRDGLIDIDNALTELVPGVDLAGKSLGAFGQTAEGFIAGTHGLVANQEEMTAWFVKDWVNAANEVGAVSDIVNTAIQGISGSAEDLSAIFAVLMEMDTQGLLTQTVIDIGLAVKGGSDKIKEAMTGLFTITDYQSKDIGQAVSDALLEATGTSMQKAAALAEKYNTKLSEMDWTDAGDITELAGLVQQRYDLEIARILEIRGHIDSLADGIKDSMTTVETAGMDSQQEYNYWKKKAEAAYQEGMNATDPAVAAKAFADAREYAMNAFGSLDESAQVAMKSGFLDFLTGLQTDSTNKLNGMQQEVIDEHKDTASELSTMLTEAGKAGAEAIKGAGEAIAAAGNEVASSLSGVRLQLVDLGYLAPLPGYAAGGVVGGAWNGKSGRAGDTVITALTPGEVVIPRAQALQHMDLLSAIAANDVRYAANGVLPDYGGNKKQPRDKYGRPIESVVFPDNGGGGGGGGGGDWSVGGNWDAPTGSDSTADQLASFMKSITRALRDMDLTEWQRQFQSVADTLADNIEQATDLGASETQLSQIRELARRQAEALAQAERDKVKAFLSDLGTDASLSPAERMAEAQRQYDEAFAAARDGLTGADEVTAAARALLEESYSYYGSGSNYQAILDAIRAGMGNLSFTPAPAPTADAAAVDGPQTVTELKALVRVQSEGNQALLAKLTAVEARLAGIESAARLEAAA